MGMKQKNAKKSNEMAQKKAAMKAEFKAKSNACLKPATLNCKKQSASKKKDKKKKLKACLKKAHLKCKKETLTSLTKKYKGASQELMKLKHKTKAFRKAQKAKKKAAKKAKKLAAKKKAQKKAATTIGKAHCSKLKLKCKTHPVLRWKCRATCNSCVEKFPFKRGTAAHSIKAIPQKKFAS